MIIEVVFDKNESNFTDLKCLVNNQDVSYNVSNNSIMIESNIDFGIHQLAIQLTNVGQRLCICDVKVDQCSVRMMLYLSYVSVPGAEPLQPATTIWSTDQTWILPFANPISFWIGLVYSKIDNGLFGKNLYDTYYIFYPTKITVPDQFPKLVKSFFEHDFDFVVIPKNTSVKNIPMLPCTIDIKSELLHDAFLESVQQRDWLIARASTITQTTYNEKEYWDPATSWSRINLYGRGSDCLGHLPMIKKLIDSLNVKISSVIMGILPPGGSIAPHVDHGAHTNQSDLYLYLPLNWPAGNYFKINGVGIISNGQPHYINIGKYAHALINDSNEYRTILGIRIAE